MALGRKTGGGTRKGRPNRNTTAIKDMILGALDAKGGQKYLERQADQNPVAFMALVAKVLPLQVTGEGGKPLQIQVVRFSDTDQDSQ